MKKANTPQDDAGLSDGAGRELCYVTDENGAYTTELSAGWEPKNIALIEAWRDIKDQLEEIVEQINLGKRSPIEYYMALNLMNPMLLAQTVGMAKWRVKRHFKPKCFKKLKPSTLEKYAEALKIDSGLLSNFEQFKNIDITEEILKKTGVKL